MMERLVRECHEIPNVTDAAHAITTYGEATFDTRKGAIETANQIHRHHTMNLGLHYDNGRKVYVLTNTMEDHYAEFIQPNYFIPSTGGARTTF